jgi:transposase InsO family protein
MQVFGLPGRITRTARTVSRLIDAQAPDTEAAIRRDTVRRWRQAMDNGLCSEQAAQAVGVPRSTLYRWEKQPEPRSRRPHKLRRPRWDPALVEAVEQLRLDNPMWGKRKLAVLLRREGFAVSDSTVGRILARLVARGVVVPVPLLRRKPGGRRWRFTHKHRHARRLPKGLKPSRPGELVQIDTLFVNIRPDRPIKHFTAYDPVAKWTTGRVAGRASAASASALLEKLIAEAPFPISGIQVDGGSEFRAEFEAACLARQLPLFVLPPKRPQLNGAVERNQGAWRYEFYESYDLPYRLDQLQPLVDAFAHRYNHVRPHDALDMKTPAEYLQTISNGNPAPSHMP